MNKKTEGRSIDRACLSETTKKMVSFKKTLLENSLKYKIQTQEKLTKLVLAQTNNLHQRDQRRKKVHLKATEIVHIAMNKSTLKSMKTMKRSLMYR